MYRDFDINKAKSPEFKAFQGYGNDSFFFMLSDSWAEYARVLERFGEKEQTA